jgi:2-(1,2-epoxy-1,2-dihydrophenyl)acetyl-CoA isomerase
MQHIRTSVEAGIGVLTIDRRERFNSLDVETAQDLRKAGLALSRDDSVRVVILRGDGGVFCSGADLKYIRDGGDDKDLGYLSPSARAVAPGFGQVFKQILEYLHATISEIRRAPKPWIAAVDGVAAAGGFGLAMACDLVFASERATFEWAYGKTALTGAESSTFLLPRLVGLRRAFGLAFLNPRLDAQAALDADLINGVAPAAGFDEEILRIARRVAAGPVKAFATTKALFNQAMGIDRLDHHLDRELEELARSADAPEFAEGIAAFFEKRPPRFDPRAPRSEG